MNLNNPGKIVKEGPVLLRIFECRVVIEGKLRGNSVGSLSSPVGDRKKKPPKEPPLKRRYLSLLAKNTDGSSGTPLFLLCAHKKPPKKDRPKAPSSALELKDVLRISATAEEPPKSKKEPNVFGIKLYAKDCMWMILLGNSSEQDVWLMSLEAAVMKSKPPPPPPPPPSIASPSPQQQQQQHEGSQKTLEVLRQHYGLNISSTPSPPSSPMLTTKREEGEGGGESNDNNNSCNNSNSSSPSRPIAIVTKLPRTPLPPTIRGNVTAELIEAAETTTTTTTNNDNSSQQQQPIPSDGLLVEKQEVSNGESESSESTSGNTTTSEGITPRPICTSIQDSEFTPIWDIAQKQQKEPEQQQQQNEQNSAAVQETRKGERYKQKEEENDEDAAENGLLDQIPGMEDWEMQLLQGQGQGFSRANKARKRGKMYTPESVMFQEKRMLSRLRDHPSETQQQQPSLPPK